MASERPSGNRKRLSSLLERFEHVVIVTLIVLMMIVVLLSVVELGWILVRDVVTPPVFVLEVGQLLELFGLFLLVLIGLELLETIKAFLDHHVVHVEIVLEVAIIALARKIIVLDLEKYSGASVIGLALLVASLTAAFYVLRRRRRPPPTSAPRSPLRGRAPKRALRDRWA